MNSIIGIYGGVASRQPTISIARGTPELNNSVIKHFKNLREGWIYGVLRHIVQGHKGIGGPDYRWV
jgi:hypothetical protein